MKNPTYIELFAGCGGLSLGLESLGFELLFANELSPMAAETFAYNLLEEDLSAIAENGGAPKHVKWLSSEYPLSELKKRLRENPQQYPPMGDKSGEVGASISLEELRGSLIVGSIVELNRYLNKNTRLAKELRDMDVDLISGGPPCQSFSMAGQRELGNSRNTLPMEFANFVEHVRPKVALLENVSGILRAFTLPDGKHYAWFEVAKAFASIGYFPLCLHVNAKYASAAQNRPRFIMLAMRLDVFNSLLQEASSDFLRKPLLGALEVTRSFVARTKSGRDVLVPGKDLQYFDIERDSAIFEDPLLQSLRACKKFYTVKDAIHDLRASGRARKSGYVRLLEDCFPEEAFNNVSHGRSENHQPRQNSLRVCQRFRLYQILSECSEKPACKVESKEVLAFLKSLDSKEMTKSTLEGLLEFRYLADDGISLIEFESTKSLLRHLSNLGTKKHTQKALVANRPAPAALSIPDDACHYDPKEIRTLTVREMARFQSFPDWFDLRSKVTTGGQMRKFEVPQYTQVGNAVPPLLGRGLGAVVQQLLSSAE